MKNRSIFVLISLAASASAPAAPLAAKSPWASGKIKCESVSAQLGESGINKGLTYSVDRAPIEDFDSVLADLQWIQGDQCNPIDTGLAADLANRLKKLNDEVVPGLWASQPYECEHSPPSAKERNPLMRQALQAIVASEPFFEEAIDRIDKIIQSPASTSANEKKDAEQAARLKKDLDKDLERLKACKEDKKCLDRAREALHAKVVAPLYGWETEAEVTTACGRKLAAEKWRAMKKSIMALGCGLISSKERMESLSQLIDSGRGQEFDFCLNEEKTATKVGGAQKASGISAPKTNQATAVSVTREVVNTPRSGGRDCPNTEAQLAFLQDNGVTNCRAAPSGQPRHFYCKLKESPKNDYDVLITSTSPACSYELSIR